MKPEVRFDRAQLLKTAVRFEEFPDPLRDDLLSTVNALANEAYAAIEARVPRRTGRLASLEQVVSHNDPNRVSATVNFAGGDATSNDFAKVGDLEWGGTGIPNAVDAYLRRQTIAFGRRATAPFDVMVAAFERPNRVLQQAFVRSVSTAMQPQALAQLNAVADRAVARLAED